MWSHLLREANTQHLHGSAVGSVLGLADDIRENRNIAAE